MDDLEELRRLLLRREREEISQLRDQLSDPEKHVRDVAGVLPRAVELSRARSDALAKALSPTVEKSIKESIEKRPQDFEDVFHPIILSLVQRAIAEKFLGLLQSLNQTLEHTFSLRGLQWRFEAMKTGRSFAEVVMLRSLPYRVERLLLVHRETSLVLLHVTADATAAGDFDMKAAMMSALQDFTRDAEGSGLTSLQMEDGSQLFINTGSTAYLAAKVSGNPPVALHRVFEEALVKIQGRQREDLAHFQGDAAVFEPSRPVLQDCLLEQSGPSPSEKPNLTRAWLALAGAAALFIVGGVFLSQRTARWEGFQKRLAAEPGLAVTSAHQRWFFPSSITGLRDPLAADPAALARQSHLEPAKILFAWKNYLALDPESIRRRFEERFGQPPSGRVEIRNGVARLAGSVPHEWLERVRRLGTQVPGVIAVQEEGLTETFDDALVLQRFEAAYPLPPGVTARVENGTLTLAGQTTYEWLASVRAGATKLPGLTALSEKDLQVVYNPKLVLERVQARFPLPEDATATMNGDKLTLAGEASHAWLERIRASATEIPGVSVLDDNMVTDLDERAFRQSKSVIESAFVYFLPNKDDFATEGFAALSRLPDEMRRCATAARRIGLELMIEVRGQADATGLSDKNADLSRRRAEAVNAFLVQCGLPATMFKPLAMGASSAAPEFPETKPVGEQSQRRVAFHVLSQAVSARP